MIFDLDFMNDKDKRKTLNLIACGCRIVSLNENHRIIHMLSYVHFSFLVLGRTCCAACARIMEAIETISFVDFCRSQSLMTND